MVFVAIFALLHPDPDYNFGLNVMAIGAMLVMHPTDLKTNSVTFGVFFGPLMLALIIVAISYSSSYVSSLTVQLTRPKMKTLEQLAFDFDGKVGSMTSLGELKDSPNEAHRVLYEKHEYYRNQTAAFERTSKGDFSMLESKTFLEYEIRNRFTSEFGETSMYVLDECVAYFPVTMILRYKSNFTEAFSEGTRRLREAGLIDKWKRDAMDDVARLGDEAAAEIVSLEKPLTLHDLQTPFLILAIGLATAAISLFMEFFAISVVKCIKCTKVVVKRRRK